MSLEALFNMVLSTFWEEDQNQRSTILWSSIIQTPNFKAEASAQA